MVENITVETVKECSNFVTTKAFKHFHKFCTVENYLRLLKDISYSEEIFATFMSNTKLISFRFKELLK